MHFVFLEHSTENHKINGSLIYLFGRFNSHFLWLITCCWRHPRVNARGNPRSVDTQPRVSWCEGESTHGRCWASTCRARDPQVGGQRNSPGCTGELILSSAGKHSLSQRLWAVIKHRVEQLLVFCYRLSRTALRGGTGNPPRQKQSGTETSRLSRTRKCVGVCFDSSAPASTFGHRPRNEADTMLLILLCLHAVSWGKEPPPPDNTCRATG